MTGETFSSTHGSWRSRPWLPSMAVPGSVRHVLLAAIFGVIVITPGDVVANFIRVGCNGFNTVESESPLLECQDESLLVADSGHFIGVHADAYVDRTRAYIEISAGGGSIRESGYQGRESSAMYKRTVVLGGEWQGLIRVEVSMRVMFRISGQGDATILTDLYSAPAGSIGPRNRSMAMLRHRGFGSIHLEEHRSTGEFEILAAVPLDSLDEFELGVVEWVSADEPSFDVRAMIKGYALPNLGSFDASIVSSLAAAGQLRIRLPCHVHVVQDQPDPLPVLENACGALDYL